MGSLLARTDSLPLETSVTSPAGRHFELGDEYAALPVDTEEAVRLRIMGIGGYVVAAGMEFVSGLLLLSGAGVLPAAICALGSFGTHRLARTASSKGFVDGEFVLLDPRAASLELARIYGDELERTTLARFEDVHRVSLHRSRTVHREQNLTRPSSRPEYLPEHLAPYHWRFWIAALVPFPPISILLTRSTNDPGAFEELLPRLGSYLGVPWCERSEPCSWQRLHPENLRAEWTSDKGRQRLMVRCRFRTERLAGRVIRVGLFLRAVTEAPGDHWVASGPLPGEPVVEVRTAPIEREHATFEDFVLPVSLRPTGNPDPEETLLYLLTVRWESLCSSIEEMKALVRLPRGIEPEFAEAAMGAGAGDGSGDEVTWKCERCGSSHGCDQVARGFHTNRCCVCGNTPGGWWR